MRKEVEAVLTLKYKAQVGSQQFTEGMLHFLEEFIFGNIALKGATQSTEWEDVDLTSGNYVEGIGGSHTKRDLAKELPGETNKGLRDSKVLFKVNFSTLVQSLMVLLRSSDNVYVVNKTFRRLCIAFAEEAKNYLDAKKSEGEYSNLCMNMPRTCKPAPEVCFDFNSGLDILKMTEVQARVIQQLNRRLFATELRKRESEQVSEDHIGDQI